MRPNRPKNREVHGRKHAVALEYSEIGELPKVVANGAGELAEQLVKFARENNIPVENNSPLTDLLKEVDVGCSISPQTFQLVAEVITFLYGVDRDWRAKHQFLAATLEPREQTTESRQQD